MPTLYRIRFYKDKNGKRPVADYLRQLASKSDKDSRIKANKINDYIQQLSNDGLSVGKPYIKHLDGEIWELRPLRDRILFAAWDGKEFLLLHHFMKDTRKTPPREVEQAKRNLAEMRERGLDDE
jgi:phage-related protein